MMITKDEFEGAVEQIWETANNADGSRAGLSEALDQIQDLCTEVLPDVVERVTGVDGDLDDDGIADEAED